MLSAEGGHRLVGAAVLTCAAARAAVDASTAFAIVDHAAVAVANLRFAVLLSLDVLTEGRRCNKREHEGAENGCPISHHHCPPPANKFSVESQTLPRDARSHRNGRASDRSGWDFAVKSGTPQIRRHFRDEQGS